MGAEADFRFLTQYQVKRTTSVMSKVAPPAEMPTMAPVERVREELGLEVDVEV